jgi:transposase
VTQVSAATVGRIWRAHGLKPHRVKSFKLSNDPRFAEKLEDVVDLYRHPPAGAVVISVDEKCQIQALDRTQPGLPWKKGRCGTMTHDYKRHGTTTLFAGMNVADGSLISMFLPTHNHQDWIRFLKLIHQQTGRDKEVHLILDNYSAHKSPEVLAWLAKHRRFLLHFTPTSSSWCNQVERFFRDLTDKCVRRGVFRSVAELQQSIQGYIEQHNRNPKPYIWTAQAKDILEKVKRAWYALKARGFNKVTVHWRVSNAVWRLNRRRRPVPLEALRRLCHVSPAPSGRTRFSRVENRSGRDRCRANRRGHVRVEGYRLRKASVPNARCEHESSIRIDLGLGVSNARQDLRGLHTRRGGHGAHERSRGCSRLEHGLLHKDGSPPRPKL